jgi:hypothetical protein
MFESPVSLHIKGVSMATETRNDVTTAVTKVGLVLEPLTRELARELSSEIADHCFDRQGAIRSEFESLSVKLAEPQQYVAAKMATDASVNTVLRHVRCVGLTVTKRGEKDGEESKAKSKKVSPGQTVLRARLDLLIDPTDDDVRKFLMLRYGTTWFFEFQDEERQLDFGPSKKRGDDDDEEDDEPRQPKLRMVKDTTASGAAAGDVLEAQLVLTTLADFKVIVTEAKYFAYSDDQRAQLVEWATTVKAMNEKPDITVAQLPQPPLFLFDKKRKGAEALAKAVTAAADKTARKPRAPRRSSSKFTNTPTLAGKVSSAKGRKRQVVN